MLSLLLLTVMLFSSLVNADCRLSDIKNVIGGAEYTVDDITASVITVDTRSILVVAG
jgi:hypothetical protein